MEQSKLPVFTVVESGELTVADLNKRATKLGTAYSMKEHQLPIDPALLKTEESGSDLLYPKDVPAAIPFVQEMGHSQDTRRSRQ